MTRPSNDRDGACICDYGPNTDGPQEDCPFHGRPYAYWIERGDALQARLDAVEAIVSRWEREAAERGPFDKLYTDGAAMMLRSTLSQPAIPADLRAIADEGAARARGEGL